MFSVYAGLFLTNKKEGTRVTETSKGTALVTVARKLFSCAPVDNHLSPVFEKRAVSLALVTEPSAKANQRAAVTLTHYF